MYSIQYYTFRSTRMFRKVLSSHQVSPESGPPACWPPRAACRCRPSSTCVLERSTGVPCGARGPSQQKVPGTAALSCWDCEWWSRQLCSCPGSPGPLRSVLPVPHLRPSVQHRLEDRLRPLDRVEPLCVSWKEILVLGTASSYMVHGIHLSTLAFHTTSKVS